MLFRIEYGVKVEKSKGYRPLDEHTISGMPTGAYLMVEIILDSTAGKDGSSNADEYE